MADLYQQNTETLPFNDSGLQRFLSSYYHMWQTAFRKSGMTPDDFAQEAWILYHTCCKGTFKSPTHLFKSVRKRITMYFLGKNRDVRRRLEIMAEADAKIKANVHPNEFEPFSEEHMIRLLTGARSKKFMERMAVEHD